MVEKKGKKEEIDVIGDSFEDVEVEEIEEKVDDKLAKLKEELKKCKTERQEYLDGWQRAKADVLNAKKRAGEEYIRSENRLQAQFIENLLPLCDSFEGAFADTEAWGKADISWRKGVEQMHAQLENVLKKYNVEKVGKVRDVFDPNLHEAVSNSEVEDEKEHDTITNVLQSGYQMGETLVRPARVVVGVVKN